MARERGEAPGTANLCFYFYFCDKSLRLLTYVKYVMEGRFDIPALVVSPPAPSLLSVISEGPWSGCNGLSTLSSPLSSLQVVLSARSSIVCEGPDMFPECLSNFTSYLLRGARAIETE